MGYFDLNPETIEDFKVEEVVVSPGFKVIDLTIETDKQTVKYRICADSNQGPLEVIKDNLNEALNQVRNSESRFGITEYLVRHYIYVTFPDGNIKQYTAKKIEI
jgi:hypothetical protein